MNSSPGAARPFSLLVKPASADCNLACSYCFYLKKAKLYPGDGPRRMTRRVLERLIQSYMGTVQPVYSFGWQGGEPLLMGLDFFRTVTDLQIRYGGPGIRVANALQTNAVLLTDQWAELFGHYRFLVGCSLDGPPALHDRYRRWPTSAGSHTDVLKGIRLLQRHRVDFNVLVLVSRANVDRAGEVYDYLLDQGISHHQYIPCVEFDHSGNPLPFAISGRQWGDFLCNLFDRWYAFDRQRVSVGNFDACIQKLLDGSAAVCALARDCGRYFVVEHNGDLYPCDFFVEKALKIANIMECSWSEALDSKIYRQFGMRKAKLPPKCLACVCFDLCMGDCPKNSTKIHGGRSRSRLCRGWKQFIRHTQERLQSLADNLLAANNPKQ